MKWKWPPTDLELLAEIYKRYYAEFVSYSQEQSPRAAKVYVPIDIPALAEHFGVDNDIIFGRLYYHLEPRYGFKNKDGSLVNFFLLKGGDDKNPVRNAVQFTILATVVAQLRAERKKHLIATWISILALIIAATSVGISLYK